MVNEPLEEKQLGGASVELVVEVGEDAFVLYLARERWVRKDHIKPVSGVDTAETRGQWIAHLDVRPLKLMKIEVEDTDLHHVGVVVVAGEGVLFEKLPLGRLEQGAVDVAAFQIRRLGVLAEDVGKGRDQEASRATRW